jgi:predicted nucleic acid-binding protein
MANQYKIYLDVCCLNRPFDDWEQERVRFEGEAVLAILKRVRAREWYLINREAIEAELERLANLEKLASIKQLLGLATTTVMLDQEIDQRSQVLEKLGFGLYDSFHIACAEAFQVDILLTTDDRLLKKAKRCSSIRTQLSNPVTWLMDILLTEREDNHDTD